MRRSRRIGVLANEPWPPLEGLRDGMRAIGYIDERGLHFEYRFAQGRAERYPALAAELVRLPADAIVAWGTPASLAAKKATGTVPIVMISGDPIAVGLVPGLAHPGANVTGLSTLAADLEGKRIEILKELLANLARVAVLSNPTNPFCIVAVENARLQQRRCISISRSSRQRRSVTSTGHSSRSAVSAPMLS
jgi:ABC-type uncharacterized transport system substrate-binding protein